MKLFVCANTSDERHIITARSCIETLIGRYNAEILMPEEEKRAVGCDSDLIKAGMCADECELVTAVGGDGTVLRAAQYAVASDKPLVGINNGRLGYLCAATLDDIEKADGDLFAGLKRSERALLSFTVGGREHFVLNDVVITKSNMGVSVQMEAEYRGEILADWRCDGVIVSTPTGSTAYNFSAGGPKLLCDLPCFVITPICPHNVNTRSIVVHHSDPVTVKITERANRRGYVYADGIECGETDGSLTVKLHDKTLTLLTK